jgi:hypothetical protein
MPEGLTIATTREDDPFAWALSLAAKIRHRQGALTALDREALADFLEEWAAEMLAAVRSRMVNLLAHLAKAANTRNPDVIGHWRSECTEFHDRLIDAYRPSMRDKIDMPALWRRAQRRVFASFRDHDEPRPALVEECPVDLDDLLDANLDLDQLVGKFGR